MKPRPSWPFSLRVLPPTGSGMQLRTLDLRATSASDSIAGSQPFPQHGRPTRVVHAAEHWIDECSHRSDELRQRTPFEVIFLRNAPVYIHPRTGRIGQGRRHGMGLAKPECLFYRTTHVRLVELADFPEQRDVGKVLYPRVHARTRQCVGMELLRDMRLDRIHAYGRRSDPGERKYILGSNDIGLPENRIRKRNVDSERLSIRFPGKHSFRPEAQAVVLHPIVSKVRMGGIGVHFECQEVSHVETARALQTIEHLLWRTHETQIDILCRARTLSARPRRNSSTSPPFRITVSPSTCTTRARKRSNTSNCRRRVRSMPCGDASRKRCSSACLKAAGALYVRTITRISRHDARTCAAAHPPCDVRTRRTH